MKIIDARTAYSAQLSALWDKKQSLTKLLQGSEHTAISDVDRLELSRELEAVSAQYDETQDIMDSILTREMALYNAEATRQQAEAAAEQGEELFKIMTILHRISSGAKVPPEDERRLMEYDAKLYMIAKSAAMLHENDTEYDSLWEDEEDKGETKSPDEVAGETEIAVPVPDTTAVQTE